MISMKSYSAFGAATANAKMPTDDVDRARTEVQSLRRSGRKGSVSGRPIALFPEL